MRKKKESRRFLPRLYCKQTGLLVLFRDIIFLAVPLLLSLPGAGQQPGNSDDSI